MMMNKLVILLLLIIFSIVGYQYFHTEEQHGPEVKISASTEMESSLWDNVLTKTYPTDNVLSVTLTPKKDYSNLSLNVISSGLNFVPNQPINYFSLTKKRVFEFKISVNDEYKKGSEVDYWVSVSDNNEPNSILTESFVYVVGKIKLSDWIRGNFWAIIMVIVLFVILVLAYTLDGKKLGPILSDIVSKLISMR